MRVLSAAPNAKVVRARSGAIVRIKLRVDVGLEEADAPTGGAGFTYREQLGGHDVVVLKRYDAAVNTYVKWGDRERFRPGRFNPDRVPPPLRLL